MDTLERKKKIIAELQDKEYRDAYVKASIDIGVPSQILILREQRNWSQEDLGSRAGMKQESISRIEDPNRGSVNLKTLIKLASAFDLGLIVRFVPFSEMVKWKLNLSQKALEADSFKDDNYFNEKDSLNVPSNTTTTLSNWGKLVPADFSVRRDVDSAVGNTKTPRAASQRG